MNKEELLNVRKLFFEDILIQLNKPPYAMDEVLNQSKYYVAPQSEKIVISVENGDLAIPIIGSFYGKSFKIYYTLWQTGSRLKIGVSIFDDEMQDVFEKDIHKEIDSIWDNCIPLVDIAHGCIFYDWTFDATNLYDSYQSTETYILGMRHMHFRIMRIIHDNCEMAHMINQKNLLIENLHSGENTSNYRNDNDWNSKN